MTKFILKTAARIASAIKGKSFVLDENLTTSDIIRFSVRRLRNLIRGFVRIRDFNKCIFIGQKVKLRHTKHLNVGNGVTIQDGVTIDALSTMGVHLGNNVNIGPFTIIQASGVISNLGRGLRIGENSGIGAFSFIGCGGGVTIGSDVIMGQYISFHSESHNYSDPDVPIRNQGVARSGIKIGNNCWVGARVTFLDGTEVGEGCVIAAGSVVRGRIPPNSVVAGIPAKFIKGRTGK